MVEEMQTDKTVGSTGGFRQRIDGQRRRVRGEDGVFATGIVKGVEHGGFDIEVLKHGFDDQVGVFSGVFHADHAGDASLNGLHLCGRENTTLHGFLKEVGDDGLAALNPLKFTVHHLDVKFFLSAFLSDAGAHVACADHGHTLDRLHGPSQFNALNKNPSLWSWTVQDVIVGGVHAFNERLAGEGPGMVHQGLIRRPSLALVPRVVPCFNGLAPCGNVASG